jgi:hypothetical protein
VGTIALAFALRTSPGDVRLVTKGDAFYLCRSDCQHMGFRVGELLPLGAAARSGRASPRRSSGRSARNRNTPDGGSSPESNNFLPNRHRPVPLALIHRKTKDGCSVGRILSMKKAGFSDTEIEAACGGPQAPAKQ